jgi:hypothetical protein
MKFKAAANSVFGSATIQSQERVAVETEIDHAKGSRPSSSSYQSCARSIRLAFV